MEIYLSNVCVVKYLTKARLMCEAKCGDDVKKIWYEVPLEYSDFFNTSVFDSFLVGIFPWALRNQCDIIVHGALSEKLFYNITSVLLPKLVEADTNVKPIKIQCDNLKNSINNYVGVGANHSLGVDSFYTIQAYSKKYVPPEKEVNYLVLFNFYNSRSVNHVFSTKCKEAADLLNKKMLEINTNVHIVYRVSLLAAHTYWLVSAIYSLLIWNMYYVASSYHHYIQLSDVLNSDCSHYEELLLRCLSSDYLEFKLIGVDKSRLEKMAIVSENAVAQKYLSPCWKMSSSNCGWCAKCKRTLIDLELSGNLSKFNECFDIPEYIKMKKYYYCILSQMRDDQEFYKEEYDLAFLNNSEYMESIDKWNVIYYNMYSCTPDWACAAAAEFDAKAMVAISKMYSEGRHSLGYAIKRDYSMAEMYLHNAYSKGGLNYHDYICYLENIPTESSQASIKKICNEHLEDPYCKSVLSRIILDDDADSEKIERSIFLARGAFEKSSDYALTLINALLKSNDDECRREAFIICRQEVEHNNRSCISHLARMYRDGIGVNKDVSEAIQQYEKIVFENYTIRMELVDLYLSRANDTDIASAISLIDYEMGHGNPNAFGRLARLYKCGLHLSKDIGLSKKLYEFAYSLNKNWGIEYADLLMKSSLDADVVKAISIYKKLSDEGNHNAMGRLGCMYRDGKGVEKNRNKALEMFEKAKELNEYWVADYNSIKNGE